MKASQRMLGIARDDSDDELGTEDLPWEWIYDDAENPQPSTTKIAGARMGNFTCYLGDTVLLKADGLNEAWVAIICEFLIDSDGEKSANFMWFSSEKEIRNKSRKRTDFMQVTACSKAAVCTLQLLIGCVERALYHAFMGCQSSDIRKRSCKCDVAFQILPAVPFGKGTPNITEFRQGICLSPGMQHPDGHLFGCVYMGRDL